MVARVPVFDVRPQVEGGRYPAAAVEGEELTVRARILGDARTVVGAAVVLTDPTGALRPPVPLTRVAGTSWAATVTPDAVGDWTFRIATWHDPLALWSREAPRLVEAEVDVELTLAEGAALLRRAGEVDPAAAKIAEDLLDVDVPALERFAEALSILQSLPPGTVRDHEDATEALPLRVDRERALVGAWYTLSPRSEGAHLDDGRPVPGTLRTAAKRLEGVAAMGFDVVNLPPLGSSDGTHEVVDPNLGTPEDLDAFVERAHQVGLEVALDLTLRCSTDHRWVREHPDWFVRRPDGSLALAGDPLDPDPGVAVVDFDADPVGLYVEVLRIVAGWLERGVRIFRADVTEPVPLAFWEQLVADLRAMDPEVVLLAGSAVEPMHVRALGTIGFHQCTTAFERCEGVAQTADHLRRTADVLSDVVRPHYEVGSRGSTASAPPHGDEALFRARAVLAATGSPTWGMTAGYELVETEIARPDDVQVRDWDAQHSIAPLITRLNEVRRAHPALRRLRNLAVHRVDSGGVVAFSKVSGRDVVLVVVDLFPAFAKQVGVQVTPAELGLGDREPSDWQDELDGSFHELRSVALDRRRPARILTPRR